MEPVNPSICLGFGNKNIELFCIVFAYSYLCSQKCIKNDIIAFVMKKILLMAAVALMAAMNGWAQQLKVLDSEGTPVPYASVLNPKGEYIGITDMEGVVADLKGENDIVITHVAFKTKTLKPSGKNQVVVLEDADYDMPEITVQPKPYIYVQTYYRMFFCSSKDGMYYYRAGLTDNTYDIGQKTVKGSTDATSKAKNAFLKSVLGMIGTVFDQHSRIKAKSFEERIIEHNKAAKVEFKEVAPGRQIITDFKGTIGSVVDDMADHQRRYSFDSHKLFLHRLEAEGNDKKLKKKNKRGEKRKNEEDSDYYLYSIDENGKYGPEDLVMFQNVSSYDYASDGDEYDHIVIGMQVFTTDRAYVTKDELKERKKANKMKISYANIRQFERDHNIPALAPAIQEQLNNLWKAGD